MIQPEFKPLTEVLANKLFRIPEYQRHYSWQKKQREELFEDIKKLKQIRSRFPDRIHFMATVVCHKTRETQAVGSTLHSIFEVVDGQQRITTLVILLKAISKLLRSNGSTESNREADELDRLLVKGDGRLIILQNNHDNRLILRNYLVDGTIPVQNNLQTHADRNLLGAIRECEKFADNWNNSIELLTLVKNCLFFIFQTVEDKGSVYTIFEVLNSRGLEVDWLDKTKSVLMGLLFDYAIGGGDESLFYDNLTENHNYWSEIYRRIGQKSIPGHEIIRFAATLKTLSTTGRPLNAEDSIDFFRSYCNSGTDINDKIRRIREMTIWLRDITFKLEELYEDKRRNAVTEITQARLLALSILLRSDFQPSYQQRLLEQWERVTFRIYGMYSKDSRTKVGDYVRTAKEIQTNSSLTIDQILELIRNLGAEFPIDGAINELKNSDCYNGWQRELRYFLFRYEEYLISQNNSQLNAVDWNSIWEENPNNSIEHVLPQGENTIQLAGWNHFSAEDFKRCVQKIGNLTLLTPGLNSEAGQNNFPTKIGVYNRVSLQHLLAIKQQANGQTRTTWTVNAINERTDRLMEFARIQWADI
ncbi:MAG: DUF262 domain-containing protein [Sphingobacteriales bacterium]|nr:DUF262 domain-containing protein [Sphingobacteriales bacterium]